MNILTDVLSLIRRSVFAKKADLDDVLILGTNEEPDMTGVASPIPYKSIKVIKVRDFKVAAENLIMQILQLIQLQAQLKYIRRQNLLK